jgi:hypothetical protein
MAEIEVEELEPGETSRFRVTVREGDSASTHEVTLVESDASRLAAGYASEADFIREAFAFLLEREPKEQILPRFDVRDISRYFPEFDREILRRAPGA